MLDSQKMRKISAETDSLYYGMGWNEYDLIKPQILIESVFGDSHPGSSHLGILVEQAYYGVLEKGGMPGKYFTTDICDGVCQGSSGMSYSLLSRDFIAALIEIHIKTRPVDGLALISSCDKSLPAHLIAAAMSGLPSIIIPGGSMIAGGNFSGCDQMWEFEREKDSGKISEDEYLHKQLVACPSEGACQGMGTASTMQILAEALGLTLPHASLIPVSNSQLKRMARKSSHALINLVSKGIKINDIVTKESIENAIMIHSAIGGSANAIIHLSGMARELNIDISVDTFDRIHREIPVLLDVQPVGRYPTEYFWYAGGVPALMYHLKDHLNLKALTVNNNTVGENLLDWERNKYYLKSCNSYLNNFNLKQKDIIKNQKNPIFKEGGLAILKGNISPGGAIVKHSAIKDELKSFQYNAKVYDNENDAIEDVSKGIIQKGDVIVIKYQGPQAKGMPEMFRISDFIAKKKELEGRVAIITDGRFSGYTKGPAIGYVTPEAYQGSPFAVIEDKDIIKVDIPNRKLDIVGINGKPESEKKINNIILSRIGKWIKPDIGINMGTLSIYRKLIKDPINGSSLFSKD